MSVAKLGCIVLFRTMAGHDLAALIVAVREDDKVNLCVFDQDGSTFARHDVALAYERDALPLEAHSMQAPLEPIAWHGPIPAPVTAKKAAK